MLATGVWTLPNIPVDPLVNMPAKHTTVQSSRMMGRGHSPRSHFALAPPVSHMALWPWEVQTDVAESCIPNLGPMVARDKTAPIPSPA